MKGIAHEVRSCTYSHPNRSMATVYGLKQVLLVRLMKGWPHSEQMGIF